MINVFLRQLLAFLLLVSTTTAQSCNGYPALCSRKYSDVTLVGTHDSPFVGTFPWQNQLVSVQQQLSSGVRFLQAQTHVKNGTLEMCHTLCDLEDAGTLISYLTTIRTFLDANPNEVITVLLTNGDRAPVSMFGGDMTASGITKYAYTPPKQLAINEWPTLQELISAGSRLVMFLDYGADSAAVPFVLDEFKYFFETAFDSTDANFTSCALDRPPKSDGNGLMMIVNHFLDISILGGILIPDRQSAPRTNAPTGPGSIGAQADLCFQTWKRKSNLILIDFFGQGDAITAQRTLNGL